MTGHVELDGWGVRVVIGGEDFNVLRDNVEGCSMIIVMMEAVVVGEGGRGHGRIMILL